MDFSSSASHSTRLPTIAMSLDSQRPYRSLHPPAEISGPMQTGGSSPNPMTNNGLPQLPSLRNLLGAPLPHVRPPVPASPNNTRLPSLASFDRGVATDLQSHLLPALAAPIPINTNFTSPQSLPHILSSASQALSSQYDARLQPSTDHSPTSREHESASSSSPTNRSETVSPEDAQSEAARRRMDLARAPVRVAQCVGKQEIPGEGVCYVYEDGSYCRTVIDGEAVNPSWGVTKAGKPRKRLAQACLTCREKKIKCEPGFPKCSQCQRARRVCRGGMSQQDADKSAEPEAGKKRTADILTPSKPPYNPSEPFYVHESSESSHAAEVSNKRRHKDVSEDSRERLGPVPRDSGNPVSDLVHCALENHPGETMRHLRGGFTLSDDPFDVEPRLCSHLLTLFFEHINSATYSMFPQAPFTAWATNRQRKSPDDIMLLYSILSMASVFAEDDKYRDAEDKFVEAASYAIQHRVGQWSLQLCQSRLLFGLWCFARERPDEAFDHAGTMLRALSALNINHEDGIKVPSEGEYGFDQPLLEECRRRTFWAGFLMDRYNGFCGGTLFTLQSEDVFLRLPCSRAAYESGQPITTPIYEGGVVETELEHWDNIDHMGHLVMVSAIWSDVWLYTVRTSRRTTNSTPSAYADFHARTTNRLAAWLARLPRALAYSPTNLDAAIADGAAGTFLSMHALYHTTHIRLNRHVRHAAVLAPGLQSRNIAVARHHARAILAMTSALEPRTQRFSFSTPFPGYAVMIAVDVLSAGGRVAALPDLLGPASKGLACIEQIARFWASARAQQKAVRKRLGCLMQVAVGEGREGEVRACGARAECWRGERALDNVFGAGEDAVYGVEDRVFFGAGEG